jgi:acetyltransferase-like isoleucine patch superfamily enzyme
MPLTEEEPLIDKAPPLPLDERHAWDKLRGRSLLALNMLAEKMLRWCIDPHLRSLLLKMLGADIGANTRINEVIFINIQEGFGNFRVGCNSHIGPNSVFDLVRPIKIGSRTLISANCTVLTHANPGYHLGSSLTSRFPHDRKEVCIGDDCWIGAGVIVLCGVNIGNGVVVRPGAVVGRNVPDGSIAEGNPAVITAQPPVRVPGRKNRLV